MNTQTNLPYDFEVEWLESHGQEWIDTGLSFSTLDYSVKTDGYNVAFGYVHNWQGGGSWIGHYSYQGQIFWQNYFASFNTSAYTVVRTRIELDNKTGIYINDSLVKSVVSQYGTDIITTEPLVLFGVYDFMNSEIETSTGRLYGATIKKNSEVIRDFIPVVKDEVGYLYDKISGKLFGNASGNGAFTCGPITKVINLPYDAEVEYIESTGTQWLDFGLYATVNTRTQLKMMPLNTTGSSIYGVNSANDGNNYRLFNFVERIYWDCKDQRLIGANGSFSIDMIYDIELGNNYVKDLQSQQIILEGTAVDSITQDFTLQLNRSQHDGKVDAKNKLYYLKIFEGNDLKLDLIPVVKNQEAYMFDKTYGKLYKNHGTGVFKWGKVTKVIRYPYDKTVQWLEGHGQEWIDTGLTGGTDCAYELKFSVPNVAHEWQHYCGGNNTSAMPKMLSWYSDKCVNVQQNQGQQIFATDGSLNVKKVANGKVLIDGVEKGTYTNVGWGTNNFYLFTSYIENTPASMRLYYGKFYTDGVLERDFIPVVKNGEGYLYDNIYGKLYRNQGNGFFTWNQSKCQALMFDTNTEYDYEVQWLESTGTQWIDIGRLANDVANFSVTYSQHGEAIPEACIVGGDVYQGWARILLRQDMKWKIFSYYVDLDDYETNDFNEYQLIMSDYDGTKYANAEFKKNGQTKTRVRCEWNYSGSGNFALFGLSTGSYLTSGIRMKSFKTDGMNLIPVVKNGIGYMYDKVSKQLFGNSGTGNFLIGPKKVKFLRMK